MKRNREMALKAYYNKQEKMGKKPRSTRTTINLPELQNADLQQPIHATTNHVEPAILPVKSSTLPLQLVVIK
ncbi:Hypothetical protein HVR_LOCUS1045 [uncultured virus]|nr:Hypothetical protein HVR_LOCUS1045 [uncultured virus]